MLRLALPVLAEQLLSMLIWFSDRALTGHYLETTHLAAITVMAYFLWLANGIFAVVAIGATAMVARFFGSGQYGFARRVTNQAFTVGAIIALGATVLALLLGPRIALFMQLRETSAQLATEYLSYLIPALPLVMAQVVGIACLRGAGDMVSGLLVMVGVNAVNVAVSWTLVLGLGPAPQLGWRGIAIGTVAGFVVGGISVAGLLLRGRAGLKLRLRWLRPRANLIRRLLRIGVPGGADMLSVIACQLWFLSVINRLGDLATAAHGVAIAIESFAFLPGVAFQMSATTLCGQYLGAKDFRRATRSVLMALLVGGGFMCFAAAIFFTQADHLAYVLLRRDQAAVARQVEPLLRIIAVGVPPLALAMILSGALRGAGDTRWPLAISLIGLVGVRLPLAYWLCFPAVEISYLGWTAPGWDLGIAGAWYAMVTDLMLRASLILVRFLHGGWKRIEV